MWARRGASWSPRGLRHGFPTGSHHKERHTPKLLGLFEDGFDTLDAGPQLEGLRIVRGKSVRADYLDSVRRDGAAKLLPGSGLHLNLRGVAERLAAGLILGERHSRRRLDP